MSGIAFSTALSEVDKLPPPGFRTWALQRFQFGGSRGGDLNYGTAPISSECLRQKMLLVVGNRVAPHSIAYF